jgi:malate dehydrogenase
MCPAAARPIQVTVTGASGQVSYALLFRIASGQLFGPDQPVALRLFDIEAAMKPLEGVVMELEDGAFPLLADMTITSDLKTAFDGTSWALLLGAAPRTAGMERGDLLAANGGIFKPAGAAIAEHAGSDVRVLVVGNPCNTNCLIARANGADVPAERWFAMMRLDANRARSLLARRAGVPVDQVRNLAIWGNHSATQYPDFVNATIEGRPVLSSIDDRGWLEGEFISTIQQRGAAIIQARGASSAASAASAVVDSVQSICGPTSPGDCVALAVPSAGQYGVPEGLQFGYPVCSSGTSWEVTEGFEHDESASRRLQATIEELQAEKEAVRHLLPAP